MELEDRVCITGVLSCPALSPDSTPDCHPGRGKATVLTGQRRHCNPSSHRPAFISFGLSQPAILQPDLICAAVVRIQYWWPPVS